MSGNDSPRRPPRGAHAHQLHPPAHRARPRVGQVRAAPLGRRARAARQARQRAHRSREDPHALSARAQRVSPHRPREVDLPQLRAGRGVRRHLPHALRRHQSGEGGAGVRRRDPGRRALARLPLGQERREPVPRLATTSTGCTTSPWSSSSTATRTSIRRRPRRCAPPADRSPSTGSSRPYRSRIGGGEPRALRRDARRQARGRRPRAAREDRHEVAQHQHARPGDLPHQERRAPPHRRQVAHLPDVHLRASDRGRAGEHHAFAVHAGVRGPAAVLRLGAGEDRFVRPAAAAAAAADRVLAAEPQLHRDEQALPEAARGGRARRRLGRSAHAHASSACAAAAITPEGCRLFMDRVGRFEVGLSDRLLVLEDCAARGAERDRAAPHRRARSR